MLALDATPSGEVQVQDVEGNQFVLKPVSDISYLDAHNLVGPPASVQLNALGLNQSSFFPGINMLTAQEEADHHDNFNKILGIGPPAREEVVTTEKEDSAAASALENILKNDKKVAAAKKAPAAEIQISMEDELIILNDDFEQATEEEKRRNKGKKSEARSSRKQEIPAKRRVVKSAAGGDSAPRRRPTAPLAPFTGPASKPAPELLVIAKCPRAQLAEVSSNSIEPSHVRLFR